MRKFYYRLILSIISFNLGSALMNADEFSTQLSPDEKTVVMERKHLGNRPKAPSMQKIYCSYYDGWISIEFEIDEGMAELNVIDLSTGFGSVEQFSTSTPAKLYVGILNGPTQLVVTTAAGQSYEGFIY